MALHGELLQELCVVARSFRARAVLRGELSWLQRTRLVRRSPLPPACSRLAVELAPDGLRQATI